MACISCGERFRKLGRPSGTTHEAGNGRRCPEFHNTIQLPTDWCHSNDSVNIDDELLGACARRISQQRNFDQKPLGVAVCYGCGHLLWKSVDTGPAYLPCGQTQWHEQR